LKQFVKAVQQHDGKRTRDRTHYLRPRRPLAGGVEDRLLNLHLQAGVGRYVT
jgi:hypothetical protein